MTPVRSITGSAGGRPHHGIGAPEVDEPEIDEPDRPDVGHVTRPHCARVLVVDADPRVRAAVRALLDDGEGTEVQAVGRDEATRWQMEASTGIDVAVVDISSPSSQDLTLVERLAGVLPVVAVSMSGSVRGAALAAGASWFIEKDGDVTALVAAIRAVIQGRSARPG